MDIPSEGAGFFEGVAATNGSELIDVLSKLGRGAADVLSALKPAASIAGPVLVVAELALKQVLLWHAVSENCEELRTSIVALTPLLEDFAVADGLSTRHGALLTAAGRSVWKERYMSTYITTHPLSAPQYRRLVDATDAIKRASARSSFVAFMLAGRDLEAVNEASAALRECCLALGAAAAVSGARVGAEVAHDVKILLKEVCCPAASCTFKTFS
jgi:hypothetical protein